MSSHWEGEGAREGEEEDSSGTLRWLGLSGRWEGEVAWRPVRA